MLHRKQKKFHLDNFISQRGLNLNNTKLGEDSIFLKRVLKAKNHKKLLSFNLPYPSIDKTPIRSSKKINDLFYIEDDSIIIEKNINKNIKTNRTINKKSCFLNSQLKEKTLNNNDIFNSNIPFDFLQRNLNKSNRLFNTNSKLNKNRFSCFMKNMNKSSENILKRYIRKKNSNTKRSTERKIKYIDLIFSPDSKNKPIKLNTNKKLNSLIYIKKNNIERYKLNLASAYISRNKKRQFYTQNNSKSKSKSKNNSISHSIDFSIINKINLSDNFNNLALSKTSDNFFIKNKNSKSGIILPEKKVNNRNNIPKHMKFLNHFIKYCYLYFIHIIKKFFNNIKKIKNEKMKSKNNNFNLFDEFNRDDFDKETIKNRTTENFFDALNDNSFSFISECKKNYIYNRKKRINSQNFQKLNLLQMLNNAAIEKSNKLMNFESKKNCFDNENEKNDVEHSPFFQRNVNQIKLEKCSLENRKIILTKNEIKEKNVVSKNSNILGYIKIKDEINPFDIKNNNNNFLDIDIKDKISQNKILNFPENQQVSDEILSFRKKNNTENNDSNIIKFNNIVSEDHKINIEIKYITNNIFNNFSHLDNNKNLTMDHFYFQFIKNNKRIKKITSRLKEALLVKEREEIIQQDNINNYFLSNLSTIKEEDSPINQTYRKMQNYYPISNNSKLFSKISVEKIIDGGKVITEEDIDKILMDSLSDYHNKYPKKKKLKSWQSQEIMVVSNFNSAMRNRRNRKENAKQLIEGLLCLIKFFGIICFNIRKDAYIQLKWNWKMNKFIKYLISFCIKKYK